MGEPGLDMGGLTKEWFQLLIRKIFEPDYGMLVYHSHSRYLEVFILTISKFSLPCIANYYSITDVTGSLWWSIMMMATLYHLMEVKVPGKILITAAAYYKYHVRTMNRIL